MQRPQNERAHCLVRESAECSCIDCNDHNKRCSALRALAFAQPLLPLPVRLEQRSGWRAPSDDVPLHVLERLHHLQEGLRPEPQEWKENKQPMSRPGAAFPPFSCFFFSFAPRSAIHGCGRADHFSLSDTNNTHTSTSAFGLFGAGMI